MTPDLSLLARERANQWEAQRYGDQGLRLRAEATVKLLRQLADHVEAGLLVVLQDQQAQKEEPLKGTYNCPECGWNVPHSEHATDIIEKLSGELDNWRRWWRHAALMIAAGIRPGCSLPVAKQNCDDLIAGLGANMIAPFLQPTALSARPDQHVIELPDKHPLRIRAEAAEASLLVLTTALEEAKQENARLVRQLHACGHHTVPPSI